MKHRFIGALFVILLVLSGCTQVRFMEWPFDESETHVHDFGDSPVDYVLNGKTLSAVYECECGKQRVSAISRNVIMAVGDDAEEVYDEISENSIVAVDNGSAQDVLDRLQNGMTVFFTADKYTGGSNKTTEGADTGYLYIRPSIYNVDEISFSGGTSIPEEEWGSLDPARCYAYTSELSSIKLLASEGADFQCMIEISTGHLYQNASRNQRPFDAVRNKYVENGTNDSYFSFQILDDFEFRNMNFSGEGHSICINEYAGFNAYGDYQGLISNFIFDSCEFIGLDKNENSPAGRGISMMTGHIDSFRDIVISNCVVDTAFHGLYLQACNNITVKDCRISNTKYNSIAIQSSSDSSGQSIPFMGKVNIIDNVLSDATERAIRIGNGRNAEILISGNTISDTYNPAEREMLKASVGENCTYQFINNSYDGKACENKTGTLDSEWIEMIF